MLVKAGAKVDMIIENVEYSNFFYRFIYVYVPQLKPQIIKMYYEHKLNKKIKTADYVLVIRGSSLTTDIISKVKKVATEKCRFIMYQWDGIKNNPNAEKIAPYFDRVYTFDMDDAKTKGWTYLPLFFLPDYVKEKTTREWDLLYVCSLHSQRVKILNLIKKISKDSNYRLKAILYMKRVLYYKYKYLNKNQEVVDAEDKDLCFDSLSIEECYKLYSNSKAVIDYTHPDQTGLTMRTIESIGNRCKLITNNHSILQTDIYNENNICIYNGTDVNISRKFIEKPYESIPDEIYNKYSIDHWITELMSM